MPAKASDKDFAELCHRYEKSGLYTHCAIRVGLLTQPSPLLAYDLLPDQRNVFDLASMTKALVTTPLVYWTLQRQNQGIEVTVRDFLGGKALALSPDLQQLKLSELLSHKSGLPAWRNYWTRCSDEPGEFVRPQAGRTAHVLKVLNRLELNPSKPQVYSDNGFILLGTVLETVHGLPLGSLFEKFCRQELHLESLELAYGPQWQGLNSKAVPTSHCLIRGRRLQGEVHDENCAALGGVTGHSGLFGTSEQVALYLARLHSSEPGRYMLSENNKVNIDPQREWLMGWQQGSYDFAAGMAMGHLGFTGTSFWLNLANQSYVIVLTNRVVSGRISEAIRTFRKEAVGLAQALLDGHR